MTLQYVGRKPRAFRSRAYGTALLLTMLMVAACSVSDQTRPQVTITADQPRVIEGESVSFTVTARPAPITDLVVRVTVTEIGAALAAAELPQNVTIAAGQTTATLRLDTDNDEADESNVRVTATVNPGTGYRIGSSNSAEVTVADNDGTSTPTPGPRPTPRPTLPPATPELPHVTIAAVDGRVTEGDAVSFTITANPAPAENLEVSVTVTETGDTLSSSAELPMFWIIGPGETSQTWTVDTVDDTTDERDSTVTATVNRGIGYTVARPNPARVTVTDNDETVTPPDDDPDDPPPGGRPTVSITNVSASAVPEGDTIFVTLSASPAPTEKIEGSVIFADSYAAGSDRYAFSFASGETTDQAFFTVQADGVDVPSRSLTISLYAFDDSYAVSSVTRTVTINDGSD